MSLKNGATILYIVIHIMYRSMIYLSYRPPLVHGISARANFCPVLLLTTSTIPKTSLFFFFTRQLTETSF